MRIAAPTRRPAAAALPAGIGDLTSFQPTLDTPERSAAVVKSYVGGMALKAKTAAASL